MDSRMNQLASASYVYVHLDGNVKMHSRQHISVESSSLQQYTTASPIQLVVKKPIQVRSRMFASVLRRLRLGSRMYLFERIRYELNLRVSHTCARLHLYAERNWALAYMFRLYGLDILKLATASRGEQMLEQRVV